MEAYDMELLQTDDFYRAELEELYTVRLQSFHESL